ncbi:MAG: hypothetical protein AB7F64_02580, partial [Gammaproteobacteria bacterium]
MLLKSMFQKKDLIDELFNHYDVLKSNLIRTPLREYVINGRKVFLKCENEQYTSSFKYRGAMASIYFYQR